MTAAVGADLDRARAADFVTRFATFWADPSPDRLGTLIAERTRLVAPMIPTCHSLAEGERSFAQLFGLIPDMTAEVRHWGAIDGGVLIEFAISGTAGGRPISWRGVDRFMLGEDGLATERVTYFDSLPLILAIGRRPKTWPGFVRTRLRR